MRVLMDQQSYDEMLSRADHTKDCYVRPGQYLHHMYRNGIKYIVARALYAALGEAKQKDDREALSHLGMHEAELRALVNAAKQSGSFDVNRPLGDPDPVDTVAPVKRAGFIPEQPMTWDQTGLNRTMLLECILRTIYTKSRATGNEIADELRLFYGVVGPLLTELRQAEYIDIAGQRGVGDTNYEYILTSRGTQAVSEALQKTQYSGPCPVPLESYVEAMKAQTIKNVVVTRRSIRQAFSDLIISEPVLNEVGPAINSASSIFLFGYPGNGKTSIA